jgi:hypothetical protein
MRLSSKQIYSTMNLPLKIVNGSFNWVEDADGKFLGGLLDARELISVINDCFYRDAIRNEMLSGIEGE